MSRTMMQLLMRANKNTLFAKYINKEPGTVIPATCRAVALAKAEGGNPVFAVKKNRWMPAFAGMTRH